MLRAFNKGGETSETKLHFENGWSFYWEGKITETYGRGIAKIEVVVVTTELL